VEVVLKIIKSWPDERPDYVRKVDVVEEVIVLEQGTESGLPLCYFIAGGQAYILSGRFVNAVSAVVKGINQRIHGTPEP
jgi:hypothetical protein